MLRGASGGSLTREVGSLRTGSFVLGCVLTPVLSCFFAGGVLDRPRGGVPVDAEVCL